MYGSLNVVVDFEYVTAPNLNESDEAINQAKNHSYAMNRDRGIDVTQSTSYVVRTLKALECFGDVGLMTSDQTRTATVVANEKTLLMKIFKDTFVNLRRISDGRELKEKKNFLSNIIAFNHWDRDAVIKLCGRMEKVRYAYNDVVFAEGENAGHFYCVKHGEVRLVKKYPSIHQNGRPCFVEICTVSSGFYFGHFEVIFGHQQAFFSALISSPSATLYRVNRIDFRQTILKDSLTENLMRSECKELKLRIQEDQVKEDLKKDIEWTEFKKNLLDTVIAEHEYNRSLSQKIPNLRSPSKPNTSNMLPKANSLIINKFDLARRPEKTSFSSKSKVAAKPASTRSPRARVASKNSQVNPKWVQVKRNTNDIL
jgi:CRP-like cAMP-binding protein